MSEVPSDSGPERFPGFDSSGETFELGDRILRGIYPDRVDAVREVLDICRSAGVLGKDIIATTEVSDIEPDRFGFGLLLEHERVPFVSLPHEWSAPALRDAAVFHSELFVTLDEVGLTLKDWHPGNVLFDGPDPVFIDFTSIIRSGDLIKEEYLQQLPGSIPGPWNARAQAVYAMHRSMHLAYFVWPLELMRRGLHSVARRRMLETHLNRGGGSISKSEALPRLRPRYWAWSAKEFRNLLLLLIGRDSPRRFFRAAARDENALDVVASQSDYSEYYEEKGEDFPFEPSRSWTQKIIAVHDLLSERRPSTVLDVGGNTGWFSILAARQGADVVSLEVDEVSSARLYATARREKLSILPLILDITRQPDDVAVDGSLGKDRDPLLGRIKALVPRPSERLHCDTVLVLGLLHHLTLGAGKRFDAALDLIDPFVERTLVLEFVAKDDPLILADPGFFPAYQADPRSFDWYSSGNLQQELARRFSSIVSRDSHPESRSMFICDR